MVLLRPPPPPPPLLVESIDLYILERASGRSHDRASGLSHWDRPPRGAVRGPRRGLRPPAGFGPSGAVVYALRLGWLNAVPVCHPGFAFMGGGSANPCLEPPPPVYPDDGSSSEPPPPV